MKYILAIDQGTTGSRAVLYDKKGRKIAGAYKEFRQIFPKPGWVEHDAQEIWAGVAYCIDKTLANVPPASVAAIGITNQRETVVVWDKETGKPVCNAIVWQCRRTAARCELLKSNKRLAQSIRAKTGLQADAYFSATKLEWILNNVPGLKTKAGQGRLLAGTIDSWLLWKLTGAHATDYTNASRTMLFNINTLEWDGELLKLFGVPRQLLPEVQSSSGIFGFTRKTGRLPAGIPVAGIAGDQQAALFGQTCFEPGSIKNTYGTGCFMLLNTGKTRPDSKNLITTLACDSRGKPVYALEGSVFIAGAAVQWLRDGLGIIAAAPETEKMALSLKSNEGVYFVPAFVGLGAPRWNQDARGLICGLTRGANRNHLARAALESICYSTKDVLAEMERESGVKVRELKVDGGAAANNFLCQFQADMLGAKIIRPKVTEVTSIGAAYLAGLATGYWKNSKEIKNCWQLDKIYRPAMPKPQAEKLYRGWLKAVERTVI